MITKGFLMKKFEGLKILVLDIETSPLLVWCWGLFDQNIGLNQIKQDWNVLSFSAKWYEGRNKKVYGPNNKVIYHSLANKKDKTDDRDLLEEVWKLLDECDILLTQNGVRFDNKKLNARFALHGMKPPSSFKHIDTLQIVKRNFALTSNKLEYLSDKFCTKYKKMTEREFAGFSLWKECLANNKRAWAEMKKYNSYDILSLEELYQKIGNWDTSIDFNVYSDSLETVCKCGSKEFKSKGYHYTSVGKFSRSKCVKCGAETRGRKNLLTKEKKETVRTGTPRNSSK
jgi:DNA polymerase elongation subunit (family B)